MTEIKQRIEKIQKIYCENQHLQCQGEEKDAKFLKVLLPHVDHVVFDIGVPEESFGKNAMINITQDDDVMKLLAVLVKNLGIDVEKYHDYCSRVNVRPIFDFKLAAVWEIRYFSSVEKCLRYQEEN